MWAFQCKCGNTVELPATRVLTGNTLSCGCLKGAHFKTTNKYYYGTSLTLSMREQIESKHSVSGYVGVSLQNGINGRHILDRRAFTILLVAIPNLKML